MQEMGKEDKPACKYCFDKKHYTVFRGEKGYDDFGGEGYEKPGEIKKVPCPRCTKKPLNAKEPKWCICATLPDNVNHCKKHCWNEVACDCPERNPKTINSTPTIGGVKTLLTELIAKCGTGYFGTKNRAELSSTLQGIWLELNKES